MTRLQRLVAFLVITLAFLVRVWALDFRPAHHDEGVNGHMIDEMRRAGYYAYNPKNFHGPLQFYVLFVGQQLFGRGLWVLRMPTALAGLAVVAMIFAFRRFLSFRTVTVAAVFLAISPGMVYFSRDAIHEMWLPFFALLATYGGFGLATGERQLRDLWCVAAGLTGMVLTKETYLLHFIAALLSLGALWLFKLGHRASTRRARPADLFSGHTPTPNASAAVQPLRGITGNDVILVWVVSIGLLVAFYSGFGFHWPGVAGIVETFGPMRDKATFGEEGHNKELLYWIKLLAYYEWPALAGFLVAPFLALPRSLVAGWIVIIAGIAMVGGDLMGIPGFGDAPGSFDHLAPDLRLGTVGSAGMLAIHAGVGLLLAVPAQNLGMRWLALYGVASLAGYSLIAYKTPWCAVNFIWPFCFVLGYALDRLCVVAPRWLVTLVAAMFVAASASDTYRLNFINPVDDSLPPTHESMPDGARYAYVQTTFDINQLLIPVHALVARSPSHRQMRGIVLGERFPLIWVLNDFPFVEFHDADVQLATYDADFLIVPDERREDIESQLIGIYFRQSYLPRQSGEPSWLYLQAERFRAVLPAARTPEVKPRVPLFR
jgi:uncharacterized protein (TIGR03663 family)